MYKEGRNSGRLRAALAAVTVTLWMLRSWEEWSCQQTAELQPLTSKSRFWPVEAVDNVVDNLSSKYWSSWSLMASLRAHYRDQYCFNVFINDLDNGMEYTLRKLVAGTKLQGAVNILDGFHSKGPGQAGEIGWQKAHYIQEHLQGLTCGLE